MEDFNTMTPNANTQEPNPALTLTDKTLFFIDNASKWSKFMSILGFIGSAFMLVGGLVVFIASIAMPNKQQGLPAFIFSILYLVAGVVTIFPNLYLYRFSDKVFYAVRSRDSELAENAFENLMRHFRFNGILFIVGICVSILGFIALLIAAPMLVGSFPKTF